MPFFERLWPGMTELETSDNSAHSRVSGNPVLSWMRWIPAFAGMSDNSKSQYFAAIGNCSAGNSEMMVWPLSVTTTSSSMRAAE
jgi:hypothetical protein